MSTVFSPWSAAPSVPGPHAAAALVTGPTPPAPADQRLAALLLAAVVAALAVLANRLVDTWANGPLLLAWVALWAVIFAGTALFAGPARHAALGVLRMLSGWSGSLAQARARLQKLAQPDPHPKATLLRAREVPAPVGSDAALAVLRTPHHSADIVARRAYVPYI